MAANTSALLFETIVTFPVLLLIHLILGTGLPVALQKSFASIFSLTTVGHCRDVTLGATEKHVTQI